LTHISDRNNKIVKTGNQSTGKITKCALKPRREEGRNQQTPTRRMTVTETEKIYIFILSE